MRLEGFELKIVTPDGSAFEGEVQSIVVRTTTGDVGILRNHVNYVATIDFGSLKITLPDGKERTASCMNGFVSVDHNLVRVIVTTFEFADEIDLERAKRAKEKAEQRLAEKKSDEELRLAKAKLLRALNRIRVSENYTQNN